MNETGGAISVGSVLDIKFMLDSSLEALKIAKNSNLDVKVIQSLEESVLKLNDEYGNGLKWALSQLGSENVKRLYNNWYAVKYSVSNEYKVGFYILNEEDINMLEIESDERTTISEVELQSILPAIENETEKTLYASGTMAQAHNILSELGVDLGHNAEFNNIKVSVHAGKRLVQRKLNIQNETKAEEYRKQHEQEINKEILRKYAMSELLWTDEDSIEYWFDDENMIYVVGNGTIITLYEEDFGFSKEVNRRIVYTQMEIISQKWKELELVQNEHTKEVNVINGCLNQCDHEIGLLEAQISEIKAKKSVISAQKDVLYKLLSTKKQEFNVESNRLFRRYKNL